MTDVRSLLRNERASRRINHPQATYSTTGTLVCLVCHIQLKSESLWDSHLLSAQHAMRLQRIRDGTLGRPPGAPAPMNGTNGTTGGSKKRKATDEADDTRKRTKGSSSLPEGFFDNEAYREPEPEQDEDAAVEEASNNSPEALGERDQRPPAPAVKQPPSFSLPTGFFDSSTQGAAPQSNKAAPPPSPTTNNAVDEDEWEAFQRDVATPPPEPSAKSKLTAAATISAAPLTTAEIAARSREEASMQTKERREAELEGEKEDAARQLEEEFDEMEELESRVRKLREKREEIRRMRMEESGGMDGGEEDTLKPAPSKGNLLGDKEDDDDGDDEDDDDNDDEDWDGWRFR